MLDVLVRKTEFINLFIPSVELRAAIIECNERAWKGNNEYLLVSKYLQRNLALTRSLFMHLY